MILIANPIYDTVFKYLVEDLAIAKRLISRIIGQEILSLDIKPQEKTVGSNRFTLTVYRVDFKAVLRMPDGSRKKVLIELQKGKKAFDIMRFRHYLGDNYNEYDVVDGISQPLPIITIYFLGFTLGLKRAIIKVGRVYTDLSTGETILEKDDFIEKLTHDSYVIQIPELDYMAQTQLEHLLSVFNQSWVVENSNNWIMSYPDNVEEIEDEDLRAIVKRLGLLMQSKEVREKVRIEEEFDNALENELRQQEIVIEQQEKELEEKDKKLEEEIAIRKKMEQELQNLKKKFNLE